MLANSVQRRHLPLPEAGVEIALLDWGGKGPLALLAHANGFCAALWAPVAERLCEHFHVVAMDARGHGDSSCPEGPGAYHWDTMAADVAAVAGQLVRETGQGRIALGIGHSFGATLSFAASARAPGLYERILMLDPVITPVEPAGDDDRAGAMVERARKRRHVWSDRSEARTFFREKELFQGWDERAFELYIREGLREHPDGRVELKCPGAVEAAIFSNSSTLDATALAAQQTARVLVVHALEGNFARVTHERFVEETPNAGLRDVAAGHLMTMENPELVAELALEFGADAALAGAGA